MTFGNFCSPLFSLFYLSARIVSPPIENHIRQLKKRSMKSNNITIKKNQQIGDILYKSISWCNLDKMNQMFILDVRFDKRSCHRLKLILQHEQSNAKTFHNIMLFYLYYLYELINWTRQLRWAFKINIIIYCLLPLSLNQTQCFFYSWLQIFLMTLSKLHD